jgi:hypothetical protein
MARVIYTILFCVLLQGCASGKPHGNTSVPQQSYEDKDPVAKVISRYRDMSAAIAVTISCPSLLDESEIRDFQSISQEATNYLAEFIAIVDKQNKNPAEYLVSQVYSVVEQIAVSVQEQGCDSQYTKDTLENGMIAQSWLKEFAYIMSGITLGEK